MLFDGSDDDGLDSASEEDFGEIDSRIQDFDDVMIDNGPILNYENPDAELEQLLAEFNANLNTVFNNIVDDDDKSETLAVSLLLLSSLKIDSAISSSVGGASDESTPAPVNISTYDSAILLPSMSTFSPLKTRKQRNTAIPLCFAGFTNPLASPVAVGNSTTVSPLSTVTSFMIHYLQLCGKAQKLSHYCQILL